VVDSLSGILSVVGRGGGGVDEVVAITISA
jgi:hypothetical protein